MQTRNAGCALFLAVLLASCAGDPAAPRDVATPAPDDDPAAVASRKALARLRRNVTLNLDGTLPAALRTLADASGVSIVLDPQVLRERSVDELRVHLRADAVDGERALQSILERPRLRYAMTRGVVFVTTPERLEGLQTRSYSQRHVLVRFTDEDSWRAIQRREPATGGDPRPARATPAQEQEARAIMARLRRKVTLDFSDTPLQDVIQFLRETSGVNIVLDPQVVSEQSEEELKVQLRVDQLETSSALRLILDLKQLDYVVRDGVVFVSSRAKLGRPTTRVY